MAVAQLSASLSLSCVRDVSAFSSPRRIHSISQLPISSYIETGTTFATGSPLWKKYHLNNSVLFMRNEVCEQSKLISKVAVKFIIDVISRTPVQRKQLGRKSLVSIRSEQGTQEGSSLDVWLGRVAMVGFAVAITVEISTGKGLLENFGVTTPLPTVALAVTGLVGLLTAVFIFQSASKN